MKICFYYSFRVQKDWNDADLEGEGLPGSETAIVHISREFAKRHQVTVYNKTSREGVYNSVRYKNLQNFDYTEPWDVFIVIRGQPPRLEYVSSKLKLYWSIEEGNYLVKDWSRLLPYVKKVITISPFHTEELIRNTPVPREKIFETRLGIDKKEYQESFSKVKNKLIYCSVPRKGLDDLAKIFPMIKREIPDASLVITSDYSLWGRKPGTNEFIRTFSRMPSVSFLGRINRKRLLYEQKTSQLHIYPCVFEELFCLSAMECQAAGTPCVCSDIGALSTTIKDGTTGKIIPMKNGNISVEEFARETINLLKNPVQIEKMAKAARNRALTEFTYEKIAREWEEYFRALSKS